MCYLRIIFEMLMKLPLNIEQFLLLLKVKDNENGIEVEV